MREAQHRTLHALGGANHSAMTGLATGNRAGKSKERVQVVGTPPEVMWITRKLWGRAELDPCANPERPLNVAEHYFMLGDLKPWRDKTYVNPPYNALKHWLDKSTEEHQAQRATEQILLIPVRPNRAWWCKYMIEVNAFAYLKPLRFVGYKQAFPAPLALVYLGQNAAEFVQITKKSKLATYVRIGGV